MDGLSDFFCDVCENAHDYKTSSGLNQHQQTLSHKRRLDSVFAAAEKAAKIGAVEEVLCELCNNGHNYKSLEALNKHNKTALHKKRLDPEVARNQDKV